MTPTIQTLTTISIGLLLGLVAITIAVLLAPLLLRIVDWLFSITKRK